jgi:hypothetical protein
MAIAVAIAANMFGCTSEPSPTAQVEAAIGPGGWECPLCPTLIEQWASGGALDEACLPNCMRCGDGTCDEQENEVTCPMDCPVQEPPQPPCGDGLCQGDETWLSCPSDCPTPVEACGNGVCEGNESFICPQDCSCPPPLVCPVTPPP